MFAIEPDASRPGDEMLNAVLLTVAFLVELAMLAAVSVWGFRVGAYPLLRWLLGLGAPLLFAVFWGLFLAPQAVWPVPRGLPLLLQLLLFGLAALALAGVSLRGWAAAFALVALIDTLWLWRLGE